MNRSPYDSYDRPSSGGRYQRDRSDERRSAGRGNRPPGPPPEGGGAGPEGAPTEVGATPSALP